MKVFIFGGTTEGRVLARNLSEAGHDITVSVATKIGEEELLRDSGISVESASAEHKSGKYPFRILTGRMDSGEMQREIRGFDICIDATHPYAVEVTSNIREACGMAGVEYVRLLRDKTECGRTDAYEERDDAEVSTGSKTCDNVDMSTGSRTCDNVDMSTGSRTCGNAYLRSITEVPDTRAACRLLLETEGNILLTTGSKELGAFAEISKERLYVRVLPTQASLEACEKAGIPHRNIIAMFGPFTQKMNEAVLEQYHISFLVTKEAGKNGGFEEKLRAAEGCGARTIVIRRPVENGMSMSEVIDLISRKACREEE